MSVNGQEMNPREIHWHTVPDLDLVRYAASLDDDMREAAEDEQMRRKHGKRGPHQKLTQRNEPSEP